MTLCLDSLSRTAVKHFLFHFSCTYNTYNSLTIECDRSLCIVNVIFHHTLICYQITFPHIGNIQLHDGFVSITTTNNSKQLFSILLRTTTIHPPFLTHRCKFAYGICRFHQWCNCLVRVSSIAMVRGTLLSEIMCVYTYGSRKHESWWRPNIYRGRYCVENETRNECYTSTKYYAMAYHSILTTGVYNTCTAKWL